MKVLQAAEKMLFPEGFLPRNFYEAIIVLMTGNFYAST
jgi:hypothetical protein